MGTVAYLPDWILKIFDGFYYYAPPEGRENNDSYSVKIVLVYIQQHRGDTMCETKKKERSL